MIYQWTFGGTSTCMGPTICTVWTTKMCTLIDINRQLKKKLFTWKRQHLSFEGRIAAIKASTSNLPVYYMYLIKMLKSMDARFVLGGTFSGRERVIKRSCIWWNRMSWLRQKEVEAWVLGILTIKLGTFSKVVSRFRLCLVRLGKMLCRLLL